MQNYQLIIPPLAILLVFCIGTLFYLTIIFIAREKIVIKKLNDNKQLLSEQEDKIFEKDSRISELQKKLIKTENDYNKKLQFAINNTPKFKVGDVIKSVRITGIDVNIHSNLKLWYDVAMTCWAIGIVKAKEKYHEAQKKQTCFKYLIESLDSSLGGKLIGSKLESELVELKKRKTTKTKITC